MEEYYKNLAELLRYVRIKKNFSQKEMAERLCISRSAYTYYETGRSKPDIYSLRKIVDLLGVQPETVLFPERFEKGVLPTRLPRRGRKRQG